MLRVPQYGARCEARKPYFSTQRRSSSAIASGQPAGAIATGRKRFSWPFTRRATQSLKSRAHSRPSGPMLPEALVRPFEPVHLVHEIAFAQVRVEVDDHAGIIAVEEG